MTLKASLQRRSSRIRSGLARTARNIRKHPYPLIVSAWVAVIYTERVVVDQFVFGRKPSLSGSLASTSVVTAFLLAWSLVLSGLLVDRAAMGRSLTRVRSSWLKVLSQWLSAGSVLLVASALLFFALLEGTVAGDSIYGTLQKWSAAVVTEIAGLFRGPYISLIGMVTLVYVVWYLVYRFLEKRTTTVEEAIHETIVSSVFVIINDVVYVWFYLAAVLTALPFSIRLEAIGGLVKDVAVYSLVALGVVIGTYKAEGTLRRLKKDFHRWLAWGAMAGGTMLFALPALLLDLNYKDNILRAGRAVEYPMSWQQDVIATHIMVRDFGLLVPLLVVAFLRFMRQVERINLELRTR